MMIHFSWLKTPLFRSTKWLIVHTINRDHDPPFLTRLQMNANSGRKIRQTGLKMCQSKSLDPYLSFPLSDQITELVNAEKIRKEILFILRAMISSKFTAKKIHTPDWLMASTIRQFGTCPTPSDGWSKTRKIQ